MMTYRRHLGLSHAVLLVYLSAVISGGLHHHDHSGQAESSFSHRAGPVEQAPQLNGGGSHEESVDCSVCIALHQAKAPAAVICLAHAFVPVDYAVITPDETLIHPAPHIQQARAPPTL
jgi:hypothetical protein